MRGLLAPLCLLACNSTNDAQGPSPSALCGVDGSNQCGSGQKCDDVFGCVDCRSDDECAPPTPYCLLGSCAQCRTNQECSGQASACFPHDHACHVPCAIDGGPDAAPLDGGACDPSASICSLDTGQCVGCSSNRDCNGATPICEATVRECVACALNQTSCGVPTTRCILRDFRCVECLSNDDCPKTKPICRPVDLQCVSGCKSAADCLAPGKCDTVHDVCVACLGAKDCSGTTPVCSPMGACVQCETVSDCAVAGAQFCERER